MSEPTLDDLEETYQLQRILEEGDVRAHIGSVYVTRRTRIFLELTIGADDTICICLGGSDIHADPQELPKLKSLYDEFGLEFERSLEPLIGEELTIESYSENTDRLRIAEAELGRQPVVDPPSANEEHSQKLSNEVYDSIQRYLSHEANERRLTRVVIRNVDTRNNKLDLTLEVYSKPLHWLVDIPDGSIDSDSTYGRIVEKIGGGSVKQIEGSSVYLTRNDDLGKHPDKYKNTFGDVPDELTTWAIFNSKQDAEQPHLTRKARERHLEKYTNHPEAWEKRPISASTVDKIIRAGCILFVLLIPLFALTGQSVILGIIELLSLLVISGGWIFKTVYY